MRTSISHPLQIAEVETGQPGYGLIGVTFCPGKYDPYGMSGAWNRDLALDLDAVRDWGAVAVVTLLESHEFELLRVERLGEEVSRRDMEWFHLPIIDTRIPDDDFERKWEIAGEKLRAADQRDELAPLHVRSHAQETASTRSNEYLDRGWTRLGFIYEYGEGVPQNYAEAATWFRLAADQGHVVAQGVRGGLYFSGRGVLKDYVVAYMWLSLSAA
jgi:hypothetical protein